MAHITDRTGTAPRRQQLPEEVATYVRELIISGEVKPGEFLRIEPIAAAVGVSNTPVREGLLSLRSQGFVQLAPRRGFVVAPFSEEDVRDLFWAQAQLGGELAARAAERISQESVERLAELAEQYEEALGARDEAGMADIGHLFHREINLAAQSHRLALLLGSIVRHLPHRLYGTVDARADENRNDHSLLVGAMRTRDARKARSLMETHIRKVGEQLIALLDERGVWEDDTPA